MKLSRLAFIGITTAISLFAASAQGQASASVTMGLSVAARGNDTTLGDGRVVYKYVDHMPEFEGSLPNFLASNIKYPIAARDKGIQGRCVTSFVVNADGHISDILIVKSSGNHDLDAEAARVVNFMPAWRPGVMEGKPVNVLFTLPIMFSLN